jgi:hypothetical protein
VRTPTISLRSKWYVCLGSILLLAACFDSEPVEPNEFLTDVQDDWILSEAEAIAWHEVKDEKGPALTGNLSWHQFLDYVEEALGKHGVVDMQRNQWSFDRWHSSEWPDNSNWSLISNGVELPVANYGANSGSTGPDGVTAALVYYDSTNPPEDISGKIVVFKTIVDQAMVEALADSDYEFRSTFESYPEYGGPIADDLNNYQSTKIFLQLVQVPAFVDIAKKGGAAGAVFVLDAGRDLMAGMYTFPVPKIYNVPSLYLDRTAGDSIIADAKAGAEATLRLEATTSPGTAYQLIGYLPGNKYNTPDDEQIQLTTHTDGPSISQDNGAFGILGVVKYMAKIPQSERPRTLLVFLDCRHFMPGQEKAFAQQDWFARNPDARNSIVAMVGVEHLGQIEFIEEGDTLVKTGRVYPSQIWTTDNSKLVELAIKAVDDNGLPSTYVRNVARPGVHGGNQGRWFGMAKHAPELGLPAFAIMGFMGAYWATSSDIERFDPKLFRRQVATVVQLTGELMIADLSKIRDDSGS